MLYHLGIGSRTSRRVCFDMSCFRAGGVHSIQTHTIRIPPTEASCARGRDTIPISSCSSSPTHPTLTPRWALGVGRRGDDAGLRILDVVYHVRLAARPSLPRPRQPLLPTKFSSGAHNVQGCTWTPAFGPSLAATTFFARDRDEQGLGSGPTLHALFFATRYLQGSTSCRTRYEPPH